MVIVTTHQCPSAQIDPPLTAWQCVGLGCPALSHKPLLLTATDVTLMPNPVCVESTLLHQRCQMGQSAMK